MKPNDIKNEQTENNIFIVQEILYSKKLIEAISQTDLFHRVSYVRYIKDIIFTNTISQVFTFFPHKFYIICGLRNYLCVFFFSFCECDFLRETSQCLADFSCNTKITSCFLYQELIGPRIFSRSKKKLREGNNIAHSPCNATQF